jgi:hypothetical protein
MEPKPRFLSALRSAVEDERRRWWVYYFAVVVAGIVAHAMDVAAFGFRPEDSVASHRWALPLDRGFFLLMPALTITAIALWVVCLWNTVRAESYAEKALVLVWMTSGSPFAVAKGWLGRIPWAAELASTLQTVVLFPAFFTLLWLLAHGFKLMQEQSRKEIEAYKARRAPKPHAPEGVFPDAPGAVGPASNGL